SSEAIYAEYQHQMLPPLSLSPNLGSILSTSPSQRFESMTLTCGIRFGNEWQ
ncbi:hypothetical protein AGABI1DRAFT_82895, partial [Agaricus bisporus var. burnettii JB137-S8]